MQTEEQILTNDECAIIAREAIQLTEQSISVCPHAESRMRARRMVEEARTALARDAARPALNWCCRAMQAMVGFAAPAYLEVRAKFDIVYDSHTATSNAHAKA